MLLSRLEKRNCLAAWAIFQASLEECSHSLTLAVCTGILRAGWTSHVPLRHAGPRTAADYVADSASRWSMLHRPAARLRSWTALRPAMWKLLAAERAAERSFHAAFRSQRCSAGLSWASSEACCRYGFIASFFIAANIRQYQLAHRRSRAGDTARSLYSGNSVQMRNFIRS
jgi:hypothetical protein